MARTSNPNPSAPKPAAPSQSGTRLSRILMAVGVTALLALALTGSASDKPWAQAYDPLGHWWLSTICAALPVLVENTRGFLLLLLDDSVRRESLKVPNEMRPIFSSEGASVEGLNQLYKETQDLADDISKGLSRSFRKLAEARVSY